MAMHDLETVFQWHPELILMSRSPVKWEGFLIIPNHSNVSQVARVKIKLTVPNFPSLQGTQVCFGSKLNLFYNLEFHKKVKNLLEKASTVLSFLKQLQHLISSFIDRANRVQIGVTENIALNMIDELKNAFQTHSEVEISSTSNLDIIKLCLKGISISLQRRNCSKKPWEVISSDLPEVSAFGPFENNLTTLRSARCKFQLQVEKFEKLWNCLRDIDENCWVLDPIQPKPFHLYRRIYLNPYVSILITLDPLNPMDVPHIKLMGSDTEVQKQTDIMSDRLHNWDPHCSILNNLLLLLNIPEFPRKIKEEITEEEVIVGDQECCICFSLTFNEVDFPDKICDNKKCRRHFHTPCLLEWLQTVPGNQVVFDYIHGMCDTERNPATRCILVSSMSLSMISFAIG